MRPVFTLGVTVLLLAQASIACNPALFQEGMRLKEHAVVTALYVSPRLRQR